MLVKKLEKNGKIKAMYASSTICASTFDTETKDLTIIFNNGGQYKYPNVELTDYTRFETAESNGVVFNTNIKKKYTNFTKLELIDDATLRIIKEEINSLKEAEDKATLEGVSKAMLESMTLVLASYVVSGKVDYNLLRRLEGHIKGYNTIANPQPTQELVNS